MHLQKIPTLLIALTLILLTLSAASTAFAAGYKALYKFKGGADGAYPTGAVTIDAAGNLYSTTGHGGTRDLGTVFSLAPNPNGGWTESVLHSFGSGTDGFWPTMVIFDARGNVYGTTIGGGIYGYGTVFQLTPNKDGSWTENLLYSFTGGTDGANPYYNLTFDAAGNLYSTTQYGGAYGAGTVFELRPNPDGSWTESVLHHFTYGRNDGSSPNAGLIFDAAGNLYGTTMYGGRHGDGTVFKLKPNPDGTWTESILHNFVGSLHGGLVLDNSGNLFGATGYGGAYRYGTVFKLSPQPDGSWKKTTLHNFAGGSDGAHLFGSLTFDAAGNLYGMTAEGGAYDCGTVFKLTPQPDGHWKKSKLHVFAGKDGAAGFELTFDTAGNLYGTTWAGGKGYGVVFKITP